MSQVPFGKQNRAKFFSNISKDVIPVNHGAYGVVPDEVLEAHRKAMISEASFPDKYINLIHPQNYKKALQLVATVIGADWHNLALVNSTTAAANCVLRSQTLIKPGVTIAITSHCFGSNLNTIKYLNDVHDVKFVTINISPFMQPREILDQFREAFTGNTAIEFVHFELIPLAPPFMMPYKEILALSRQFGVKTIVDAAHSIGQIHLDFSDESCRPDIWFSNLHKWCYVPKGSCVMHVDPKHHGSLVPWPIQYGHDIPINENTLVDKFQYVNLKNYPIVAVIPTAIEVRKEMGGEEAINSYCSSLAENVGKELSNLWGTKKVIYSPQLAMVNIQLPVVPLDPLDPSNSMQLWMCEKMCSKGTFAPTFKVEGEWYVRFSCQVYNELEDFIKTGKILLDTINEWNSNQKGETI
ncbi:uncharacterized protein KQ657_003798 [Scheffersomyces spartinae]|uniref:Aminotransferase class V domain-containing protein n=1 Tax=Scheffersomyces spartinae TaxID=45513 RepID=A0A9P8AKM5_9ASCO|nr:uncharacterized protein KQ657_003798 [Scheffersomyces spartinae]KAG7195272.1 hypothetical protein KQ657_003798 [Scheffersomyces spartinae]